MNDTEIEQRLASAARVRDDELAARSELDAARGELLEAILESPAPVHQLRRGRTYRRVLTGVAAAGVAAAVAVPVITHPGTGPESSTKPSHPGTATSAAPTPQSPSTSGQQTVRFSLAAKKFAQRSLRVLLDAPGWKMGELVTDGPKSGTAVFRKGPIQDDLVPYINPRGQQEGVIRETPDNELELNWHPADKYATFHKSRSDGTKPQPVTVLGRRGMLISYGAGDYAVLLPPKGDTFLEFRGTVGDQQTFLALLRTAREVDADTWLRALPDTFVLPGEEMKAARKMVAGLPMPPGLTLSDIKTRDAQDHNEMVTVVTKSVMCGWLDDLRDAKADNDAAEQRRATRAIASSKNWKVLKDLRDSGWPIAIWDTAAEVAAGRVMSQGAAAQDLGCGQPN